MSTNDTIEKRRANAHFKKEARKADSSQATEDYQASQKGAQKQLLIERSRLLVRRLLRQHRRAGAHARADAPPKQTTPGLLCPALARDFTKRSFGPLRGFVKSLD